MVAFGITFGLAMLVVGTVSYCIGFMHGQADILDEWENSRKGDW